MTGTIAKVKVEEALIRPAIRTPAAVNLFFKGADYYLVARALANGQIVVTLWLHQRQNNGILGGVFYGSRSLFALNETLVKLQTLAQQSLDFVHQFRQVPGFL
ncbi:MAG TPA: DUF4411 family protein [bacterium]